MKLGINKKLIGAQGIGFVLFVFLAVFSYFALDSYSTLQKDGIEIARRMELVSDLQVLIDKILMPPNDYLITGEKKEREKFAALVTKAASLFERIRTGGNRTQEEISIGKNVEKGLLELEQKAMVLLSTDNPIGNKDSARLMKDMDAFEQVVENEAEKFHDVLRAEIEAHSKSASMINTRTSRIFTSLTAVFLSAMIFLIYMVIKGVVNPISELTEAVKVIGHGQLDHRVRIKTGDEMEALGNEFNNMAQSLKEKIDEVKQYSAKFEKTNRQLEQNIVQLYTLFNISKTISATHETEKLLIQIVKEVEQSLKIHRINIMLIDEDRTEMFIAAGTGITEKVMKTKFKIDEGIYGWVALTGHPMIIDNPSQHQRFKPTQGLDDDISSLIVAPFKGRGEVIGTLNACKLDGVPFDDASFELLTAAANQIGMTLENARLFEETRTLAITDGMTSLYNYRYFQDRLREEFNRAMRYRRPLSLIMIDVDFFKKYNDTHGHLKGDKILTVIAGILKRSVRATDIVARYGGEEFVVVLPETDGEMAFTLAERLRKEVESCDFPGGQTQPLERITISLGVSSVIEGVTRTTDDLIKSADRALYQAKEQGKNRCCS